MPTSRGFRAMQIGVALLLLTAAGLKTHELATRPVLGDGLLESRGMLIAVVEFEYLFGVWLLAGLYPAATWRATMGLFTVFVGVSLYKAVSGAASCGCFGTVEVNPWYTVGLDLAVLGWLFVWRPGQLGSDIHLSGQELRHRLAIVCSAWLLLAASTGVVLASHRPTRLGDAGQLLADGRTVVLEPETWVGKRFPLLDWIEIDAPLDRGQWTVVLYQPGCPECEATMRSHRELRFRSARHQVAFVEVSPIHAVDRRATPDMRGVRTGRLKDQYVWFVNVPTRVFLSGGFVQDVSWGGLSSHRGTKLITTQRTTTLAVASASLGTKIPWVIVTKIARSSEFASGGFRLRVAEEVARPWTHLTRCQSGRRVGRTNTCPEHVELVIPKNPRAYLLQPWGQQPIAEPRPNRIISIGGRMDMKYVEFPLWSMEQSFAG